MKSAALRLAFHEVAEDDMGIYPASTRHPDGREEKRTEWQDGWNAAVMDHMGKVCKVDEWFDGLPEHVQPIAEELIVGEALSLSIDDDSVQTYLRVNDTFEYACSDCEDVTLDDLPMIARLWRAFGYDGLVAWVANKRGYEPLKEYRSAQYLVAKECCDESKIPREEISPLQPEVHPRPHTAPTKSFWRSLVSKKSKD